ncbi:MAG: hypothetical protein GY788_02530, partial [bacterium]|nr:hypothetical protein [bacterium]
MLFLRSVVVSLFSFVAVSRRFRSLAGVLAVSLLVGTLTPVGSAVAAETITQVQSNSGAGSASSFDAGWSSAATQGNLLVVGVASGGVVSKDLSESSWSKAVTSDVGVDKLTLWYKVADGDASDDDVTFTMSPANQYSWVYAEYSSSSGWGTDPLDVTGLTAISGASDDEVSSGTTGTPSGDGLGVAMFRLRDGLAVSDLGFTNDYSLVDSDGTQFGNPWSIEGIMAANTATTTVAQSTVASWTPADTRTSRGGVIAVFQPAAASGPSLVAGSSLVSLSGVVGGVSVSDVVSIVASDAPLEAVFSVSDDASWLTVTAGGTTPADVTLTADPTDPSVSTLGVYEATVTVTAPDYTGTTIAVSFEVTGVTPSLEALPTSVVLSAAEGGGSGAVVVVGSGGDDTASSMSFDIGTAGTDRVVAVYVGVENEGVGASSVTVDGKAAALVAVAENSNGVGNHSELWSINESGLGSSSGVVTVAAQGVTGLWGIESVLLTGVDQSGPYDFAVDNSSVGTTTITPGPIDVPAGGVVVMVGGEGTQNLTMSPTSPLVELESHDPNSADMFMAAGIETSEQLAKSYVMSLSGTHNRASGVVASWAPASTTAPVSTEVKVSTSDDSDVPFTVTDDAAWLTVTPTSGTLINGEITLNVTATPGNPGVETATITVTSTNANPVTIPVTLNTGINTAPVATDVSVAGVINTEVVWAPDVSDIDNDELTCSIVDATGGVPFVELDCSTGTFDATGLIAGTYSVTYQVSDTVETDTAVVTVTITGNHPPTASDVTAAGDEGTSIAWTPIVSDPETSTLSCFVVADSGFSGQATVDDECGPSSFDATNLPDGVYSFDYFVDDTELTNIGTVTITVGDVPNHPPVATGLVETGYIGTVIPLAPTVTDPDGDDVTCSLVPGSTGEDDIEDLVTFFPGCTMELNATDLTEGTYSFQYQADDQTDTARATVTVGVSKAPPAPVDPSLTVELDPAYIETMTTGLIDPRAVTVADIGVIVAEQNALMLVDRATGEASTWVGSTNVAGCVDSTDPTLARFTDIDYIATDQTNLYVADQCSGVTDKHSIRKVDLTTGATTTIVDGNSAPVNFSGMRGLTAPPDGSIYITRHRAKVDRLDPATGAVTNIRTHSSDLDDVHAITSDDDFLYVMLADHVDLHIERIDLTDYTNRDILIADTGSDRTVLVSAGDYLYTSDAGSDVLQRWTKINPAVTYVAGSGVSGFADGIENEAWFGHIASLASDGERIWILDHGNLTVRAASDAQPLPRGQDPAVDQDLNISAPVVVTVAGNGTVATVDGTGDQASFENLKDVVVVDGYAYVAQQTVIRKVDLATGDVTTLAGQAGVIGQNDATDPAQVTFNINRMITDGYWLYTSGPDSSIFDRVRRTSIVTGATSTVTSTLERTLDFAIGPDGMIYRAANSLSDLQVIDPVAGVSDAVWYGEFDENDKRRTPPTFVRERPSGIAADSFGLWLSSGGGLPQRVNTLDRHDFATGIIETLCVGKDLITYGDAASAGAQVLIRSTTAIKALAKTQPNDCSPPVETTVVSNANASFYDPVTQGLGFSSIAGMEWDGEAIYVVDSGTNRLRMIVDGFNPPGGFAMGYDGYGSWRHGVNAGLGNFVWSSTDATIGTAGPSLDVTRTYNSSDPRVGPFGLGWTFTYDMR